MLSKVDDEGLADIVSWQPHGRCFVVHKPKEFVSRVMPTYFRQSKLTSFQRQLNLYGFARITTGRDRGGYYHERFLRHKLFLCQNMSRIRIKGTGIKGKASPETEPDFYSMPWVEPGETSRKFADLEGEVAAAIEEESKRFEPSQGSQSKCQNSANKRKKAVTVIDAMIKTSGDSSRGSFSSPRILPPNPPFAVVTPDTHGSKRQLPAVSIGISSDFMGCSEANQSTEDGKQPQLLDLFPPLLSSDSDETSVDEPHSGDEIAFEGQHFHYLDSFTAQSVSTPFTLRPRENKFRNDRISEIDSPCRKSIDVPTRPSLVAQAFREPIMTPSYSSSSLSAMANEEECLQMNPDIIFSEKVFNDEWDEADGDTVDIETEFSLIE
jgi:hypothetical protein